MSAVPIKDRKKGSQADPLSLFSLDYRDVSRVESHMSPLDCGRKKKQRCCETELSSCWGNWVRKWGSVWGHGIQTQQSEDFVFLTIPPPPTRSCCQSFSHTNAETQTRTQPQRLQVLYPPEVRVWYQPICFSHPRNPSSHSHTTPDPSCSYWVCATTTPKLTAGLSKRLREKVLSEPRQNKHQT